MTNGGSTMTDQKFTTAHEREAYELGVEIPSGVFCACGREIPGGAAQCVACLERELRETSGRIV
jgi:hypothetical protein